MTIRLKQLLRFSPLVFSFIAFAAGATTLRAYCAKELTLRASNVILAEVSEVKSHLDKNGQIARTATLEVEEYIIGEGPSTVQVRLLGGTIGDITSHVSGAANLRADEQTLLFLFKSGDGINRVVGMAQGCFQIVTDPITQTRFATRTLGNLLMIDESTDSYFSLGRANTSTFIALDDFVRVIKKLSNDNDQK